MSQDYQRVIVIGGGVVGAACAYYLSRSGRQVTIVERARFGEGCSHANCGLICPSHVLPLAGPSVLWGTIRALLSRNSPFSIKPRLDFELLSWMARFARRCNHRDMLAAGEAIQPLLLSSRSLYDELMQTEPFDCEWQTRGLLFVFETARAMAHYGETNELTSQHFGVCAEQIGADALAAMEPALKPGLAGGFYFKTDAHLRPDRLMSSWRGVLNRHGVQVQENCTVRGFIAANGKAAAVTTNLGELPADAFVIATGAWTPSLAEALQCNIPIQPGKGYSITMPRPARCPTYPLIFEEHRVAVTPMDSGYRLGSTMEFAGYDTSLNPSRLALLREGASRYLHEPYCEPVEEEWYGWRPMTPDSIPIIDRSPAFGNVIIAAGHNMLGVSMSPGTGKLVAELMASEKPHLDPSPYRATRF